MVKLVIIKMLVRQIKNNNKRLEEIEIEVLDVYDKIGEKLHTYPCINKLSSAYILAEIGNINRFKSSSKLAKYSGIAPVNRISGKSEKEIRSEFGNRDLNSLIYNLACRSLSTGKNRGTPYNAIF